DGISARVINARFAKPLDQERIRELAEENIPVVTVEEASLIGGFGSAVLEFCEQEGLHINIKRIGVPDYYVEHGSIADQLREVGLTSEQIRQQIRSFLPDQVRA